MTNKLWDKKRKAVYELLKKMRVEADVTQVELSAALNKPQSYVSKYETGERKLDLVEVSEICEELGTTLSAFSVEFESCVS
jgi:transcriptional regulator with XRE-family HTH domain